MFTNEKGYSLSVLVITIAVMLILTMTAVVTLRNVTADREITNFMSDLQEVEQFAKEYYAKKGIIPALYGADGKATEYTLDAEAQTQVSDTDNGKYYRVDLSKLGSLNLVDSQRGYVINEGSLKIYVSNPITYQGIKYYTLTDEMLGINRVYGADESFEIKVTGNPLAWTTGCKLMVSVPDEPDVNDLWTFKYYKGGPITAEQFKSMGNFFEYGDTIEVTENDIYSIYVENKEGFAKVTNVIVNKVDDIEPYIYTTVDDNIVIRDDETGISRVMYKIVNYGITENKRAETDKAVEAYFQGTPSHLPNAAQEGRWTYLEAYTGERVDGVTASVGKSITTYKSEYEEYLRVYNEHEAAGNDLRALDAEYPQFQFSGETYSDEERNIVLYVEDYAGNKSVTDRNNVMYRVSRKMLLDSNFVDTILKPLNGAQVVINEGAEYTNDKRVSLTLKAQGSSFMYFSYDGEEELSSITWMPHSGFVPNYELKDENGEIELFAYFTANQTDEHGDLIYTVASDKIFLDTKKPTLTAPTVDEIGYDMKLTVHNKQEDKESGLEKVIYGYKKADDLQYTWVEKLKDVILEPQTIYHVRTRATDKAGNVSESDITEVRSPAAHARTLPNEPAMATGMKAIVWDGTLQRPEDEIEINPNTWLTANGEKVTWYNYSLGNGMTDSKDSIWANAKTMDGSYWVWIPRYAYKIVYYTNSSKTDVKGYYQNSTTDGINYYKADGKTVADNPDDIRSPYASIDIMFLSGTSNTQYKEENLINNEITVKTLSNEYIVHPAFQRIGNSVVHNADGNWSSELTGIWVAKFEASRSDATIEDQGVSNTIKSVPSVKSFTNVKIGDAYDYASVMYPALLSHMMKSSEWGATAYLAFSAYGRNGYEMSANRASSYITGAGGAGTGTYSPSVNQFKNNYAYDVAGTDNRAGMHASTTGNIYGVYDLIGGAGEYVATYLLNMEDNISENGTSLTDTVMPYMREAYNVGDPDGPLNNYKKNGVTDKVHGNAIYETSTHYVGNNAIFGDTSKYPSGNKPFFIRGGEAKDGAGAGIFSFEEADGAANETTGFRPVLAFR